MISNAIPGIANVNTLTNTTSAKGIAVSKEVSKDFQKTLGDISSQKQAVAASVSITKTMSTAVNTLSDTTSAKTANNVQDTPKAYEKEDAARETAKTTDDNTSVNKTDNTDNAETNETATIKDDTNTDTTQVSEEVTENTNETAQTSKNPEETVAQDELGAEVEAMLEAARQLMEQLADQLQIDIHDIENAMETLGLTNIAILDNANMTQIIAQVTGAEDVMAIVTNADLYMSVQDMQDAVDTTKEELMQEFGFTEDEFSEALEEFAQNMQEREQSEAEATVNNPIDEASVTIDIQNANVLGTDNNVEVRIEGEAGRTEKAAEIVETIDKAENITSESAEETTFILEPVKQSETKDSEGKENHSDPHAGGGFSFNHLTNQISSSLSEVTEAEETQQMPRANTQQIMEQITESIKLNITQENTRMELQLHPASLGTVNVMVEQAKDGNMIAKFFTHNEDVKAAIESQLQVLQEKFNEQGVKVTAVEVTVNTGGFDQTLNDSQSQKEDDQDAQESIRKPMRRIRLDDLMVDGEGIEGIDEEDQLTAEMMAINGNSVDFSA